MDEHDRIWIAPKRRRLGLDPPLYNLRLVSVLLAAAALVSFLIWLQLK